MRRLITSVLTVLLTTVAMMAQGNGNDVQGHWTFDANQYPGETVIYCDLVTTNSQSNFSASNYEVAAFIGDDVRGIGDFRESDSGGYFIFRVKGSDDDMGQSITFKAYNTQTQIETDVELREQPLPITYDGETKDPGTPSNLRHLYITEIESISLPETLTLAKGGTLNLTQYITVAPEGAKLPAQLTWDFGNSADYISVEDNILTALQPKADGAYLGLRVGALSAYTNVIITNPATALTILDNFKEITVERGDYATLTKMIQSSYELTPADATDEVVWTIEDESIVEPMLTMAGWNPKAAGTTTMTAQIMEDNDVRLSATLTVHVTVPVESVGFDFEQTIGYLPKYIECNMGDNIDEFLKSHVQVLPADATNAEVEWSLHEGNSLMLTGGVFSTLQPGMSVVRVASVENSKAVYDMMVMVYNPATDVEFNEEVITATYSGEDIDLSSQVMNNFNFIPKDFESITKFNITIKDGDCVEYVGGTNTTNATFNTADQTWDYQCKGVKAGEATIEVSFVYVNWLNTYANPNDPNEVEVRKSFTVSISEGLTDIEIIPGTMVFGEDSEILVVPNPVSAQLDLDKLKVTVAAFSELPEAWTQTLTNPEELDGQYRFVFKPVLPGQIGVTVEYDGEVYSSTEIDVVVPFSLEAGWQWRTLFYGTIDSANMEEAFSGDNLIEIRSFDQLLYNDPVYGYFGDLYETGVGQEMCYKIKMASPNQTYYLQEGYWMENDFGYELNEGWTWLPNPYMFERPLSVLNLEEGNCQDGDKIVSKDDGFAEFDAAANKWQGTLTTLTPGQGYLYYTEGSSRMLSLNSEFNWGPVADNSDGGTAQGVPSGNAKHRIGAKAEKSVWSYDSSLWRDNMSIVAEPLNAEDLDDDYTVGAFVNGECRGEGRLIDGRLFITVHGKNGELVSFKFHSNRSGEYFDAEQTVKFRNSMGSVKEPVKIKREETATGIRSVDADTNGGMAVKTYDLQGREVGSDVRGIVIERMADGSVRKVLRK